MIPTFGSEAGTDTGTQNVPSTEKYLYVNEDSVDLRTTPEFSESDTSNVDLTLHKGSVMKVDEVIPFRHGNAVRVQAKGKYHWIFQSGEAPHNKDLLSCSQRDCPNLDQQVFERLEEINQKPCTEPGCASQDFETGTKGERPPSSQVQTHPQKKAAQLPYAGSCVSSPNANTPKPNFRRIKPTSKLKSAFIQFMTPYAVKLQSETGLPASVVIAQTALETGYGRSTGFQSRNSAMGHSCWKWGQTLTYWPEINGKKMKIVGHCKSRRPEGGYYVSFDSLQDSLYAYAYNILGQGTHSRYYAQVQRAVAQVTPPEAANRMQVIAGLKYYAQDVNYRDQLLSIINSLGLASADQARMCLASAQDTQTVGFK